MNKSNKLLVGILAFVVVCVIGYALFSETITVTGTATASGSFDITMSCTKGVDDSLNNQFDWSAMSKVDVGYENDECIVNGNTVTYGANLLYPGARRLFTIIATNTGSIPATLTLDETGISQTIETCSDTNNDGVVDSCQQNTGDFGYHGVYGFVDTSGKRVYPSDADFSNFLDANDNAVIKPGEGMIILGITAWLPDYDGDEYNNVLWKTTSNSTYNFKQVTSN